MNKRVFLKGLGLFCAVFIFQPLRSLAFIFQDDACRLQALVDKGEKIRNERFVLTRCIDFRGRYMNIRRCHFICKHPGDNSDIFFQMDQKTTGYFGNSYIESRGMVQ